MNGPNEPTTPAGDDWSTCDPGTLQTLGRNLRNADARQRYIKVAQAAAVACVVAVGVAMVTPGSNDSDSVAMISCEACYARFAAFEAHATGGDSMPEVEAKEVAHHLAECVECRTKFNETYPGVLAAYQAAGIGLAAFLFTRRRLRVRQRRA